MKEFLSIKNLCAKIENTDILKGVNLDIKPGEIHAIMGPNGSGKSTLSKILAGHPAYQITNGQIIFKDELINELDPPTRSHNGIFLAFQYPVEVPGVSNEDFLRTAYNSARKSSGLDEVDPLQFLDLAIEKLKLVGMDASFLTRNVNEGFSGGEKKRNEILQFAILNSDLGILDETDSGLDIDALKTIATSINNLVSNDKTKSIILITHYNRLLEYIKPDFVHVMYKGQIIKTGDANLAQELEEKGYEWLI